MQKIYKGEEYNYFDSNLNLLRNECKSKCFEFNSLSSNEPKKQKELMKTIINTKTENFYINKTFICNFGNNISIGDNFYSSFNLTLIDENKISFGNNIYLGPNCTFNTINKPSFDKKKRSERILTANTIDIGNNVFFEGQIIVTSGVTINDNVIIKAGSKINKNIPSNSIVEGINCEINQLNINIGDSIKNYCLEMINKELTDEKFLNSKKINEEFNNTKLDNFDKLNSIIKNLYKSHKNIFQTQKCHIQNGNNTSLSENFYTNYNFVLLDTEQIVINKNSFIGPNGVINNNTINIENNEFKVIPKPIKIGENCWIASNVYIKGGVTIEDNSTIGANSVVLSDIPKNCVAFGNPAKIMRKFTIVHNERIVDINDKRSEKEKSLNGELYFTGGEELSNDRISSFKICFDYNKINPINIIERKNILKKHFGMIKDDNFEIDSNFNCDYGYNISIGKNFKSFYNLLILDENYIIIGDNVTLGPNISLLTAIHPIEDIINRNSELEYAKKIEIGNDVWIEGNVVILPGIKIGNNVIIESGCVVTKNIPDNCYCGGNPCKVIKSI